MSPNVDDRTERPVSKYKKTMFISYLQKDKNNESWMNFDL